MLREKGLCVCRRSECEGDVPGSDQGAATMTQPQPQPRRQVEIHIDKNDYLTISFIGDIKFAGRWYGTAEVIREKLTSHSSAGEAVLAMPV